MRTLTTPATRNVSRAVCNYTADIWAYVWDCRPMSSSKHYRLNSFSLGLVHFHGSPHIHITVYRHCYHNTAYHPSLLHSHTSPFLQISSTTECFFTHSLISWTPCSSVFMPSPTIGGAKACRFQVVKSKTFRFRLPFPLPVVAASHFRFVCSS